jgi:murein DD-endopeptidase MepM/ murein hydrolase activator NlpD
MKIIIKNILTFLLLIGIVFGGQNNLLAQINYRSKIAETEKQAEILAKQVNELNDNIHELRLRQGTLQEEITKIKEEAATYTNISIQARGLAAQYLAQKQDLEVEISRLKDDVKKIYGQLQKQNLTSPIQSIFTAKNLGEAISRIYANSTLEQKAQQISYSLEERIAEKERAIENQKQTAARADISEKQAVEKQMEAQRLLEDTKGDENKYKEIANQKNKEIEDARKLEAKYAQAEKEEQDRIRKEYEERQKKLAKEAERQAAARNTYTSGKTPAPTFNFGPLTFGNYNKNNTGFNSENYDGKCRFEALSSIGVNKGYFATPTVGNFEREFGWCNHDGIDISNVTGTPIYAAASGKVVRATYTGDGYGNNVIMVHTINGRTIYTLYGHLSVLAVGIGDTIAAGQVLGKMGSTGNSTGSHLHFMIMDGASYDGPSCRYANTKCWKPRDYINF